MPIKEKEQDAGGPYLGIGPNPGNVGGLSGGLWCSWVPGHWAAIIGVGAHFCSNCRCLGPTLLQL